MKRFYHLVAVTVLVACSAESPTSGSSGASLELSDAARAELRAAQEGRRTRGFEDELLRLEGEVRGLGGMYKDEAGNIVVHVQRGRDRGAVTRELRGAAAALRVDPEFRGQLASGNRVIVRDGDFTFSQLVAWQRQILGVINGIAGFTGIDADERVNRVRVLLLPGTKRSVFDAAIRPLGVPSDAMTYETVAPGRLLNLSNRYRPLGGGIIIRHDPSDWSNYCTMGFNVSIDGPNESEFLTAGHCNPGGLGNGTTGGAIRQNTSSNADIVGYVHVNPAWNRTDAACGSFSLCTWADVLLVGVSYMPDMAKKVAITTSVGTNNSGGSTTFSSWNSIVNAGFLPYVGLSVDKVGVTSGWTRGTITRTCTAISISSPSLMNLCTDEAGGMSSGPGDSGSPVFATPSGSGPYSALGTLWGGSGFLNAGNVCVADCLTWFNNTDAIATHLSRTLDYATPSAYTVSINGPHHVPPETNCTWTASTTMPSVYYEWRVDGNVVSQGSTLEWSTSSAFSIDLLAYNHQGAKATAFKFVTTMGGSC